ncbi:MAG: hypothetical protein IJ381_04825 [Clostridia bacterium]|nr:hypothetical protein [Clostridia bacterium]
MLSNYRVYRYDQLESPAVTAGTNAVLIGAQNGLFPDMGSNVPGEMGGLWAGEKKVCDGFFFAVDDVPLLCADCCEAHPVATAFHYRMQEQEMHIVRRQYIPDGVKGCVIELTIENQKSVPRMVEISFTVRTEILTVASAQGTDGMELGRDVGEYDEMTSAFYARDSRNPWHAVWGADTVNRVLQADLPQTVYGFGNTQGKGINGRLFYRVRVSAQGQTTMRLFVAGGFASRLQAEDALANLRANAAQMYQEKEERIGRMMLESAAELPDRGLERSWNWARIYGDWLTRRLPQGGMGLCCDLPEHPSLFGDGWAAAMGALLPQGGAERVMEMLRTMVRISEEAQLAAGRLPRKVSRSGRILQVGGVKESAQFVALVHKTLLWTGDVQFAQDMLPMTGLCISYLRRSTRNFDDIREDIAQTARQALEGQAYILNMTGADNTAVLRELQRIPARKETAPAAGAPLAQLAEWHGRMGHVEQMIGCLISMSKTGQRGVPGAVRSEDVDRSILLSARSAAGFVWPMTECLFGLKPDAGKKTIVFAPHTPIGWDGWLVENVRIGNAVLDVKSERISPSQAKYTISVNEDGWKVVAQENGAEKTYEIVGELSLILGD